MNGVTFSIHFRPFFVTNDWSIYQMGAGFWACQTPSKIELFGACE